MALLTEVQHLRTLRIVAHPYHILPNVWKASRHTPSVRPFLLMFRIDRPIAHKFISCVAPGPSQWFFHFGEEIVIAWTHIG